MKAESLEEFAALIGIDWADRRHVVCLQVNGPPNREVCILAQKPEAIDV